MNPPPISSEPGLDLEVPEQCLAYLRAAGRLGADEAAAVRVLAGGVSNRTVWLQRASGETWVLKQALERLRVAEEWCSSPARIHREALGMAWLGRLTPSGRVPRLVFEDEANHVLAMTAVPEPHVNWKAELLAGRVEAGHVRQAATLLAAIHREARARQAEIEPAFRDRGFFESLRLEPYYLRAAERVPAAAAFLKTLVTETRACAETLVHGDFSPKNLLVHADQLVLLDHEVIHWGDPAFDLGFFFTHLLSKAHHLPAQRGAFCEAALAFWLDFAAGLEDPRWANALAPRAVRHALACLLARVDGCSPLEYLDATERARQRAVVLQLLNEVPSTPAELIERFRLCLSSAA